MEHRDYVTIQLTDEQARRVERVRRLEDGSPNSITVGRLGVHGRGVTFQHVDAESACMMHAITAPDEYATRFVGRADLQDVRPLLRAALDRIEMALGDEVVG